MGDLISEGNKQGNKDKPNIYFKDMVPDLIFFNADMCLHIEAHWFTTFLYF